MEIDDWTTRVEKHITDCSRLLVYFDRVASENDAFGDNACRVRVQESAHGYKLRSYVHTTLMLRIKKALVVAHIVCPEFA